MNFKSFLFLALVLFIGCHNETKNKPHEKAIKTQKVTTDLPKKKIQVKAQHPDIDYTALAYRKSDSGRAYFEHHFTKNQKEIIYGLNRIDAHDIHHADTLIIPDTFFKDWKAYSPFPLNVKELDSVNKLVIFSYPIQAFAAYENGILKKWGPTSMGSKSHPTPTGLHFSNWKSKKSVSTVKDTWILPWNFNIINKAGVGWHQYHMPGYPASHSCLRLHEEDAKWLYYFADQWILANDVNLLAQGTPVIVYGAYPYGERKPWLNLLEDAKVNVISKPELVEIVSPYLSEIMKEQNRRKQVLSPNPIMDSTTSESN